MENIVKSKCKCPKCGNKSKLKLVEVWSDHTITWSVEDGKFDRNDGALEHGDAYKVIAECRECGHIWRIRHALQIDDVIE